MRKIIKLLLVVVMCFSFIGCSGGTEKEKIKDPKETNRILSENNYEISFGEEEKESITIMNYESEIVLFCQMSVNKKIKKIGLSDFSDYSFYHLYPDLDKKGDSIFYNKFNEMGITIEDIKSFVEWYYEVYG